MATQRAPVDLDTALIDRARAAARGDGTSDTQVVEDVLTIYLGLRALDDAHAQGGLHEDEANLVAAEEVRAFRRTRGTAV